MRARLFLPVFASLVLSATLSAQDSSGAMTTGQQPGSGQGRRGGFGGMMGARGTVGTVTEVAADHYTIKTENGETYTIHYSVNTRILKQAAGTGQRGGHGSGQNDGADRTPPTAIKPTDIKVGDAVAAVGEVDAAARSVGAVTVIQIDPERAKQMREMQANYGKTWLAGKVTAIDGIKVTILGINDKSSHSFVADENTTFRKRREPITLGDIQVGDMVRAEGGVTDGAFLATTVTAMPPPPEGNVPRNGNGNAPPNQ